MKRMNFPGRKALRREEAIERDKTTKPENRKAARKAVRLTRTFTLQDIL